MKQFSISNFKSFARDQKIPLKPITLIYGANSAGKSSVIHSFLLFHHILKTGNCNVSLLETPWDNVDLGGFKQFAYKHRYDNNIVFSVLGDNDEKLIITVGGAIIDDERHLLNADVHITSLELIVDDNILVKFTKKYHEKNHNYFKIVDFNFEHEKWLEYSDKINVNIFENVINPMGIMKDVLFDMNQFFIGSKNNIFNINSCKKCFSSEKSGIELSSFVGGFLCESLMPLFKSIWNDSKGENSVVNYIGPLRNFPPRIISDEGKGKETADKTWNILLENEKVREKVNKWLGNRELMTPAYQLKVEKKINPEDIVKPLLEKFSEINIEEGYIPEELETIINIDTEYDYDGISGYQLSFDKYGVDNTTELIQSLLKKQEGSDEYNKLVLLDKRSEILVSLRDVGVGISQVLPVLVNAYAPDSSIVAIEQPEIHLHPKLQSELADVFIETALGDEKKTYLIETHSEHLLLRIMRRIRESTSGELPKGKFEIKPDDVQILFVMPSQNAEGSVVKKIALDEDGEMVDTWPGGFFEEGFNDRFGL